MSASVLLSPSAVAAAVGVSPLTVRRWCAAGRLPALRLGHGAKARYRIDPVDLAAFLRHADTTPDMKET